MLQLLIATHDDVHDALLLRICPQKQGMAVVGVWVFELAEAYCAGLKAGGLIASVTEED